eukprot:33513_1
MSIHHDLGTPFSPLVQLMGVLPAASVPRINSHWGGALRAARSFIFRRVKLSHVELAMDVTVVRGLRLPVVTIDRLELAKKKLSELSAVRDSRFFRHRIFC